MCDQVQENYKYTTGLSNDNKNIVFNSNWARFMLEMIDVSSKSLRNEKIRKLIALENYKRNGLEVWLFH